MKKLTLLFAFSSLFHLLHAQDEFQRFKLNISLAPVLIPGMDFHWTGSASIEPQISIITPLSVGVRAEYLSGSRNINDLPNNNPEPDFRQFAAFLLTSDYYLIQRYAIRPFVGAGYGFYGAGNPNRWEGDKATFVKGGMMRAGFEARHFRMNLEYNIVPQTEYTEPGSPEPGYVKNSFIALRVGINFWGEGR